MMKQILAGLLILAVVVAGSLVYAERSAAARAEVLAEAEIERHTRTLTAAFDAALAELTGRLEQISERFERIDNLLTAQELQLRRYGHADHLQRARALGPAGPISGTAEIERLVDQHRLVRLADTPYYFIQWEKLEYSVPYVTPDVARLLELIGERFHAELRAQGLPLYRYCISSILRTAENQRDLRRINPNAARGLSAHEFGTTLDIVYHRYGYGPRPDDALPATSYAFLDERLDDVRARAYDGLGMRYWQELQGMLGRVLIDLQSEGKVYVMLERNQPVFHLTIAQPLTSS